jgi:hypothetical protein
LGFTDTSPPGNLLANSVSLPKICVFLIWCFPYNHKEHSAFSRSSQRFNLFSLCSLCNFRVLCGISFPFY